MIFLRKGVAGEVQDLAAEWTGEMSRFIYGSCQSFAYSLRIARRQSGRQVRGLGMVDKSPQAAHHRHAKGKTELIAGLGDGCRRTGFLGWHRPDNNPCSQRH